MADAAIYNPVGLSNQSFKNMQLGAGAFYLNLDMAGITTDTPASTFAAKLRAAKAAGKCLGATIGGGTFSAVPEVRQIEADGMRYPIIGSTVFDSWEITLATTIKEITRANMDTVLATGSIDPATGALRIMTDLTSDSYIPTLGWAGMLLGGRLVYIEIVNALNISGMELVFVDKGEGQIACTFRGHLSDLELMDYAPARIFFF